MLAVEGAGVGGGLGGGGGSLNTVAGWGSLDGDGAGAGFVEGGALLFVLGGGGGGLEALSLAGGIVCGGTGEEAIRQAPKMEARDESRKLENGASLFEGRCTCTPPRLSWTRERGMKDIDVDCRSTRIGSLVKAQTLRRSGSANRPSGL